MGVSEMADLPLCSEGHVCIAWWRGQVMGISRPGGTGCHQRNPATNYRCPMSSRQRPDNAASGISVSCHNRAFELRHAKHRLELTGSLLPGRK
jgi:hypothetical protein